MRLSPPSDWPRARVPAGWLGDPPARRIATQCGYFTGIMRCWYGVPAHITYGACTSGSALFGYAS